MHAEVNKAGATKAGAILAIAMTASVAVNLLALQEPAQTRLADRPKDLTWVKPVDVVAPPVVEVAFTTGPAEAAGDDADVIRGVQRELNARTYEAGQPDGVAGLVTRAAVMAYEHDYHLPLTATPSQDVLSRIVLGSSASQASARATAPTSEAQSVIRLVKQSLAALGYQPGRVDGALTAETARAIREFETDQRLAETGRISGPLMSRLLRLQGQAPPVKAQAAKPAAPKPPGAKARAAKPPAVAAKPAPARSAAR
ncbi:MAG: peptidoglycan-binding protein [Hyphomicrobium sp.]